MKRSIMVFASLYDRLYGGKSLYLRPAERRKPAEERKLPRKKQTGPKSRSVFRCFRRNDPVESNIY